MAFNFRYNDTNYKLATSDKGSINFCYREGGSTYKVPALSTRGTSVQFASDDNYTYYMDNSSPTLCFRKNDTNYYCAKSISKVFKADIPAGTYTPSAFETLIKKYISANGSRTCSNDFYVRVNNQTIYVSKGTSIKYFVSSSSPQGYIRSVGFDGSGLPPIAANDSKSGFTDYKIYVVYMNVSSRYNYITLGFLQYANYNITVTTGIKFK